MRSPTFVLIMEHSARIPLYHVDLYRLERDSDLDTLGLDEYVRGQRPLCLVEWADRAPHAFPPDRLDIRIERVEDREDERKLTLTAAGRRHIDLLEGVLAVLDAPAVRRAG